MHDQPVVVPGREPARLREHVHRVAQAPLLADVVDRVVVEEQERAMQPGDDHVLVVARIADDRGAVGAARQILEDAAALDLELDVVAGVVELLLRDRAGAVDRVEVERRSAEVAGHPQGWWRAPASRWRRRSRRGRGTGRGTSSLPSDSGCWGCSRSARGRRSVPWARPRADRRRRAGRRACRARAAPPRPSGSAGRTAATGRSARNARRWRPTMRGRKAADPATRPRSPRRPPRHPRSHPRRPGTACG